MRCETLKRSLLLGTGFVGLAMAGQVAAQQVPNPQTLPPPAYSSVDANGVDLNSGRFNISLPGLSIGAPDSGMSQTFIDLDLRDNLRGTIERRFLVDGQTHSPLMYTVIIGGKSTKFLESNNDFNFQPYGAQGAQTLSQANGAAPFYFTDEDGARYKFEYFSGVSSTDLWYITSIERPDGEVLTYTYVPNTVALRSIVSNLGYMFHYDYSGSGLGMVTNKITAINLAVEYCASDAVTCQLSNPWPYITFPAGGGFADAKSNATVIVPSNGTTASITSPTGIKRSLTYGSSNANLGVDVGRVTSVAISKGSNSLGTWTYGYSLVQQQPNSDLVLTASDPVRGQQTIRASQEFGAVVNHTNFKGETTAFQINLGGNFRGRIDKLFPAQGGEIDYDYDSRGNLKSTTKKPRLAGLADIVELAGFDATCANVKTCNKPTSRTDARQNTTDYEYYAHGGLKKVRLPAVTAPNGATMRPTTTYEYEAKSARYKGAGNTWVDGAPVYRPTRITTCRIAESCPGTADEIVTTISYGLDGQARNLLPMSVTVSSGNGAIASTRTMEYDEVGNLVAIDGPLDGTADTTRYFYDAVRQKTGVVEPDADGVAPFVYHAVKFEYNADGRVTEVKEGTVTDPTDKQMATLVVLRKLDTVYDDFGRKAVETVTRDGSVQSITQFTYDAGGRLTCTASRSDLSASLPASACLQRTPTDPKDRITYVEYDPLDRPTLVSDGYGTAKVRNVKSMTYTVAGGVNTIQDGKLNTTTYEYDGFDRLEKVRYPNKTGGGSSVVDYDFLTYDASGNRKTWQHRYAAPEAASNFTVTYDYDALNRVVGKTLPATTYVYDNQNNVVSSSQGGVSTSETYDALGRKTSEAIGTLGAVESEYDAAGRRWKLKWPDGNYVKYEYDNLNRVTFIRENGAASGLGVLAAYTYDSLGRRKTVTRGNGVTTTYNYSDTPLTWSMEHNLAGSNKDLKLTFAYNAFNQIVTRTNTNDVYDWKSNLNFDRSYDRNGLNQLTVSGGQSLGYSPRGNMSSDGTYSYQYDIDNRLVVASSGAVTTNLSYDGMNRLYRFDQPSPTRLLYDGLNVIGEYNDSAGGLQRRYVPGPNQDEPIVWYEGGNLSAPSWLLSDNQGSIISRTDSTGQSVATNTFDEYGFPAATNSGLFQYTGQVWLSQLSLYHYKARTYSPVHGRFLQTDPIGYADGLNLYAYTRNDPVNFFDPLGLDTTCRDPQANECQVDPIIVEAKRRGPVERLISVFIHQDGSKISTYFAPSRARLPEPKACKWAGKQGNAPGVTQALTAGQVAKDSTNAAGEMALSGDKAVLQAYRGSAGGKILGSTVGGVAIGGAIEGGRAYNEYRNGKPAGIAAAGAGARLSGGTMAGIVAGALAGSALGGAGAIPGGVIGGVAAEYSGLNDQVGAAAERAVEGC